MSTMLGWFKKIVKYFSSSISKKIIIPYALLTIVLAALGVFIVVQLVAQSFEDRLQNQLKDAAKVVSDEIVNRERVRLEIERAVSNTIGVADAVINRDVDTLNELISPVIANAGVIDSIIIVDTQAKELLRFQRKGAGADVFIETQPNSGLDLSEWPAVTEVLSNPDGFKSIQLVHDPELDELIIYTVGPVRTSNGVVGAALVGTYLRRELGLLRDLALAQLTLFDNNGKVLATTFVLDDQEQNDIFAFFTPKRYQEVVTSKDAILLDQTFVSAEDEGASELTIRDQGYRLAYAPFILRGQVYGVYAVALPTNFITGTTNQTRFVLITIFSIGVIVVFGVGFIISRRISQPILHLVKTSQAISKGDLDQRTGIRREDEIGILATAFDDMTGELQYLLKVQEEEASKLNAILKSIADGVIVQDAQGNILIMNPAADKMLAFMEEDLLRATLKSGQGMPVSGNEQTTISIDYLNGLEFHETHRFEIGNRVYSALSAPVITSGNSDLGVVVVLRDITREVESEKLKDDFITSMSHELRTPLTAIKGYNELLKMTATNQLDPRQMTFVETIGDNVNDLLGIIQQMLDLSQIDAGTLGIDKEPLNLAGLVKEESISWQEKMAERDMGFITDIPTEEVWVRGDQNRLSRVVHNLIKNAYDYTLPGGNVKVKMTQDNGQVQVDVQDTGVGISKEDQRFLFTRFFRAIHNEYTFEVSGAGLGLYTSKAIIEAHNGQMWMKSELNRGSTFSFTLSTIDPNENDFEDW